MPSKAKAAPKEKAPSKKPSPPGKPKPPKPPGKRPEPPKPKPPVKRKAAPKPVISERDREEADSGADMDEPQAERHGDARPSPEARRQEQIDRMHRDPRIEPKAIKGQSGHQDPRKQIAGRLAPRMQAIVNWWRRAPKRKQN